MTKRKTFVLFLFFFHVKKKKKSTLTGNFSLYPWFIKNRFFGFPGQTFLSCRGGWSITLTILNAEPWWLHLKLIFIFKEGENCCLKLNCFRGKFLTLLHYCVCMHMTPFWRSTRPWTSVFWNDRQVYKRHTHTRFTFSNPLGGDWLSWTCPPTHLFSLCLCPLSSSQSGRIWSDGRRLETCSDDNLQQPSVELSSQLIIWLISIPGPIPKFPVVKK